ncbi:MAG: restriction endonuclease [Rhodocyclales bacterium]|nr:restriction endonuclease [Rhodocyclales bacterium]
MADLLFGERWHTAAWRAVAVFGIAYVLPAMLFGPASRLTAFLQLLATVMTFGLTAAALYRLFQLRAAQVWGPDDEVVVEESPPAAADLPSASVEGHTVAQLPLQSSVPLEKLGQVALERLCMALYQFNGLNSQTVAIGADGAYRIRLFPRNADKALAILQCHAGEQLQELAAYTALLRVMEEEGVGKAFFVAPAGFAAEVRAEARSRHVTLVDLKLLQAMLDHLPEAARATTIAAAD